ncbi:FHF complex subunit HOOK-interacting protein 1A [Latimeria chalumnae]|uniref:FHF complex subunit HOOK interacting protein 1A n=1 Tax=Latimeria chalumnae TaxID=7897 RepID=H3A8M0_LATCH|nr:PREDICTED: protein FAM160A1 [Latimeria chalumnae]XP_014344054.1 PREDICTED: protein FAM160A1 [Latimeria chalumnae]XP_014344055.1 PREDICTED: protein FAM160A1 [Latimeria chalumnae]|eukprot:XP_005996406.1 PREDICTED: protein FAM160A1 [Latimeria chalumnae]
MASTVASGNRDQQAVCLQGVDPETCMIVFKNHWAQVAKILEKHDPLKNSSAKHGKIPADEASAVQNYVEHMLFLLIEERTQDAAMGPILEFVVSENVMEKLFLWSLRRQFTDEMKIEQLKMYEMLVTQSHQPLLHHKPILKPLMMLLSSCSGTTTPVVEGELVLLLNQLCSILAKDPSILELFFHTSEDQGATNFLIFSLLIPYIHREGTVGQQARDALLFIMSLSAENWVVAKHIVENTFFCPVLATGLSGLYSSLPTKLEEKNEDWHCLLREDWLQVPTLIQFMNSLEFCNAVIQVAHPVIQNQLVDYIYNGFLVPVVAPALHKMTVEEVMTTTAYLDLFLRSVSEPALLKTFCRFIVLHQHENVHILDTLVSRINTPFRLCVVSLAFFRTLIGLYCEDVMLQLVLRYLIPCNHMMLSQRWAVRERDCYSVSAAKLLALTPGCCSPGISLSLKEQEGEYILWSKVANSSQSTNAGSEGQESSSGTDESTCIVEYGKPLDITYLQYLWEAQINITHCISACRTWSAPYNGENPNPDKFLQTLVEENGKQIDLPGSRLEQKNLAKRTPLELLSASDKMQQELEWDDSYDTGMSPGSEEESPRPFQEVKETNAPALLEPPKHIQEMRKSAIMFIKGSYIEESEFQDDIMVYQLCAQKDSQDTIGSSPQRGTLVPATKKSHHTQPPTNGPIKNPKPNSVLNKENTKNTSLNQEVEKEQEKKEITRANPEEEAEQNQSVPCTEPDHNSNVKPQCMDSDDLIAQYDDLIENFSSNSSGPELLKPSSPDPFSLVEDKDDFENFSVDSPSVESLPSPFGAKHHRILSSNAARALGVPFTGPFVSVLLSKLENMLDNSLHVNLLLTGIVAQLACYPQPLLRSFLLNTNMVFQPSVRSLYQVLASVKNKIEQFASTQKEFPVLFGQAQQYLLSRADVLDLTKDKMSGQTGAGTGQRPSALSSSTIQPFSGNKKSTLPLPNVPSHVRSAVFAAVLFPEFLKELAAIAQEHSILPYTRLEDRKE